ncbi:MAG: excinuclease ABC subunit C [Muribaculaceae bacterium]|nr:excinuclease ABC subunit C [Muribaculaceae bacterium]
MTEDLKLKLSLLPDEPGVYRYKNREGTIIYVGKAKNLKRRVNSYFNRDHATVRTNLLVRNIDDLEYTVVNTEEEALDLENSLIKEYQPRYNVLLKDDKSYPWICVSGGLYPRVFITRDERNKGDRFYGPYPRSEVAKVLIDTIRQIYPLRTCRLNVSRETIESGKHRLCLQYHIHRCEGCCKGLVTPEQYGEYISEIRQILNGDTHQLMDLLMRQMQQLANELRFEEAECIKHRYKLLEHVRRRSVIVSPTIHNIDIFGLLRTEDAAWVNFMHMRGGAVVQSYTLEYRLSTREETDSEIMSMAIAEVHKRFAETYRSDRVTEVIVNVVPDVEFAKLTFIIPQRGDKKKLLDIALKNATQKRTDRMLMMEKLNPEQRTTRVLDTMKRDLRLAVMPRHIECFDNSNISGSNAVASCVVFRNAKPAKKEYRHFNIKTVEGADDFASMREVVTRRYRRLAQEGHELPQLLIVDGGKGQVSSAIEALSQIGLKGQIAVVGIAKRLNEVFFPGDSIPLYIDKNSETLRVIQHLRDEAHRFAITFHRKQRSKSQVHSALDDVPGIGPKTRTLLIKQFKSLKRIKEAALEDLAQVIGQAKAQSLYETLHGDQRPTTRDIDPIE